jgi:hypothetical protein
MLYKKTHLAFAVAANVVGKIWVGASSAPFKATELKFQHLLANLMHPIFKILKFGILRVSPLEKIFEVGNNLRNCFHELKWLYLSMTRDRRK